MSIFEFSTVAVSLILGLAVACVLESLVTAFRARRTCKLDWIPFLWVAFVLMHQFQFWWALYEINSAPVMSLGVFISLLYLSGVLFVAGALVLPNSDENYPEDLGHYFTTDGSWAALAIALYNFSAIIANRVIFHAPIIDPVNLFNVALGTVALAVGATRSRSLQVMLTFGYAVLIMTGIFMASSLSYESVSN